MTVQVKFSKLNSGIAGAGDDFLKMNKNVSMQCCREHKTRRLMKKISNGDVCLEEEYFTVKGCEQVKTLVLAWK